ncbi:MAG: DUF1624 domain-containing protein [Candidatus Latescibacteria bacterium]|nr:DUF1624 domain-containing protein [Candidatus Latescibacterota bacterium]
MGPGPYRRGSALTAGSRIVQLDLLRGLVVVIMALDHVAFFVAKRHPAEFWNVPLPQYPHALAFFTRAITHLSAPGFFLLMGAGMALFYRSRTELGWSQGRLVRYFAVRGLVLVAINQLIENPAWAIGFFTTAPGAFWPPAAMSGTTADVVFIAGVLTGLGLSMAIAGLMLRLPTAVLLVSGLAAIGASQLLLADSGSHGFWARLLNAPGVTGRVYILYAVLPWLGVTLCGVALGRWMGKLPRSIGAIGLILGVVLIAVFAGLRAKGGFGNHHAIPGPTLIDFLNMTKYPPSMAFLALTLGINLMLLGLLPRLPAALRNVLVIYGKAPLCCYLAHIWLFALVGLLFRQGTGYGVLYVVWDVGLVPLFYICKRYSAFKQAKPLESRWRML